MVVSTSAWPSSAWTVRMSLPLCSRCVAKQAATCAVSRVWPCLQAQRLSSSPAGRFRRSGDDAARHRCADLSNDDLADTLRTSPNRHPRAGPFAPAHRASQRLPARPWPDTSRLAAKCARKPGISDAGSITTRSLPFFPCRTSLARWVKSMSLPYRPNFWEILSPVPYSRLARS